MHTYPVRQIFDSFLKMLFLYITTATLFRSRISRRYITKLVQEIWDGPYTCMSLRTYYIQKSISVGKDINQLQNIGEKVSKKNEKVVSQGVYFGGVNVHWP